ncbi:MAG: NTP transferase domain-containing protein [Actinobacteria bacterium]|nr:NTP transferase domain-containing protein [Actinomycetota bacterium]
MTIAAVVLAAGGGTRWDGGGHKLLADLGGRPLAAHAIDAAAASGLDELVVVTGAADLSDVIPDSATVLYNPDWEAGQAVSLQLAVEHCRSVGHEAIVVGLADTPGIPAAAWQAVAEQSADLVCATFDGRRRPPVKVAAHLWDELPVTGDVGARLLLRWRASEAVEVACDGEPADVDTLKDLSAWS